MQTDRDQRHGGTAGVARRSVDTAPEATVLPSFSRLGFAARRRLFDWSDPPPGPLRGRTAVVTGATGGLGEATVAGLAALGARVWLLGRDRERAEDSARQVRAVVPAAVLDVATADLASLGDVRRVSGEIAARADRVDVLVHNAGVQPAEYRRTDDGLELTTPDQPGGAVPADGPAGTAAACRG
jgi:hypothetical protein